MRLLIITQKVDKDDSVLGFFHDWIEHIAKHTKHVSVIALAKGKYDLPGNVEVVSLGKENGSNKFTQAIRFYFFAFKFLLRVDGVFVHMAPEYVRALYPLNLFFRKPLIMWYAHIHVSKTARWAIGKANKILTPSKESFELDSNKVIPTGHGIDTNRFSPFGTSSMNPPLILTMSRISRVKRIHIAIEALRILRDNHPNLPFQALITGRLARPEDGEYLDELKTLIKKYGLESQISWYKDITDTEMPKLYNKASVFVRPQGGGGFGKAELAAMACGIPSVVCTLVYIKDLGKWGNELYFEEDNASMCAEKIAKVLGWSEADRKSYADLARGIVVKNHNIENLAKRIVAEFDTLLNSPDSGLDK